MLKYVCLISIIFVVNGLGEYTLKHVQVLFRHGDRAPVIIFPNDVNNASEWKNGIGELTDLGIRQQFKLGFWIRQRYKEFFGSMLSDLDMHVTSSNYDRTIMSAESNIAGIIFNNTVRVIPEISWRPITIHSTSKKNDYLLDIETCPRYKIKKDAQYSSKYFKEKLAIFQSLLLELQRNTGIKGLSFINVWMVYDTLLCERIHNMTKNIWVTEAMWDKIVLLNIVNWELMFYGDLARLSGGLLLKTIIDNMQNKAYNGTWSHKNTKMIIYSGHDNNIAPLAKLLGFYENIQPPYSSCIIFELYYNAHIEDPWAVKVIFKNDSESKIPDDIYQFIIPGCSSVICPLTQFKKVTKDKCMSQKEYQKECAVEADALVYVLWIVISIYAAFCLIIFVIFCLQCYRKRSVNYSRFDENIN